jgi:hypothetical protein
MTKRRRPAAVPRMPWHRRAGAKALAACAGAAAALWGGNAGWRGLRAQAAAWPETAFDASMVDAPARPAWLQREVVGEALAEVARTGPLSRARPELLAELGAALERSAWVRAPKLRWQAGRVVGDWQWRTPAAAIPWTEKEACYIDAEAVVLRVADLDPVARRAYPRLQLPADFDRTRLPAVGSQFSDPRLLPAARLAAELTAGGEGAGATLAPRSDGRNVVVTVSRADQNPREYTLSEGGRWQLSALPTAAEEYLNKKPVTKK